MAPGFRFGVTGRAPLCVRPQRWARRCQDSVDTGLKNLDQADASDLTADPIGLYIGLTSDCLDGGDPTAALSELGAEVVRAQLSDALERELWGLDPLHDPAFSVVPSANDHNLTGVGPHLTDDGVATVVGTGPLGAGLAFAQLQQAWADCAGGRRMIVLAPSWVVTELRAAKIVGESSTTPGVYQAGAAALVVEGSGFWGVAPIVGGSPASTSRDWMFAVAGLDTFTSPQFRLSAPNTTTNEFAAVVEQFGMAVFSRCCVLAVEVNVAGFADGDNLNVTITNPSLPVTVTSAADLVVSQVGCP